MKCPKCKDVAAAGANFCQKCGTRLKARMDVLQGVRLGFSLLVLLFLSGWIIYFFKGILFPFHANTEQIHTEARQAVSTMEERVTMASRSKVPKNLEPYSPVIKKSSSENAVQESFPPESGKESEFLPVGVVSIYDPWDNEIAAIPAIVVDASWVALPVRACYGGVKWVFYASYTDFVTEIDGGQWLPGEDVSLWHLQTPLTVDQHELYPWEQREEAVWRSLVSIKEATGLSPDPDWQQGAWFHSDVPKFVNEPGVFMQKGNVVGWTFGDWLGGGYWWQGAAETGNRNEVTVNGFYNVTFAGGREEMFVQALAIDAQTLTAERLQTFLEGFFLDSKLDLRDVPESLFPENVMEEVRALARELRKQGRADRAVAVVDARVIRRLGDFELLKVISGARIESAGFASAVDFVEEVEEVFQESSAYPDLQALHVKLYQLWMERLLAVGDFDTGWQVLQRSKTYFADDPQLYLDGVDIALAEGDWALAEELLWARQYPASMSGRVDQLADQISELKGREGKIVISFEPGSNHIPVTARLNNSVDFPFLVDTGASLVSIPAALLPSLGLEISHSTPRRQVATAGGMYAAWEVTLSSIELEGWVVQNVKAIVVDTKEQNDFGLLGMNFLNRFQMQLDSDEGVLILNPQ